MNTVNDEFETALSKLAKQAVVNEKKVRRRGFLAGQISIPADFDRMEAEEIESQFNGDV